MERKAETQPVSVETFEQIAAKVVEVLGVDYLGRVRLDSDEFRVLKWEKHESELQQRSIFTYLYFVFPECQAWFEISLSESFTSGYRHDPSHVSYSGYWGFEPHVVVPYDVPGYFFGGPAGKDGLWLKARVESLKLVGMSDGGSGGPMIKGGDIHVIHAFSDLCSEYTRSQLQTDETFADVLAGLLTDVVKRSNILNHALPGKFMPFIDSACHTFYPSPKAFYELADCADSFWVNFPISGILKHCQDVGFTFLQYLGFTSKQANASYREFNKLSGRI